MIKLFSNQTSVPKITVESKFLKNKTTILTPDANGLVKEIKSDTLLFVKVGVSGLLTGESIGKLQLALAYVETSMSYNFKVIKCPKTTLTENYMKEFANSLTGEEVVEEAQVIYGTTQSKKAGEQKDIKFVTLDLTNMAKKALGNNPTLLFVVKNNSEDEQLHLLDPQYVASQIACCNGTMSNFNGLNGMYQYDQHQIGGTGTGYINLYNQKLIHIIDGLTSLSKKMPIIYSTIHNYGKSNEKAFLEKELTPSFQYKIFKSGEEYVIEDPTGNRNYYQKVDTEKEEGEKVISTYGMKHLEEKGDLYFCNIDYSYFYLDKTTSSDKEEIVMYDRQDNKTTFEVKLNVENITGGRFTKLLFRANKYGDFVNYHWSGLKLEKIINSDKEEVLFTYDSSNRISKIDYPTLKQYIEYTYKLNEWAINIAIYSYKLSSKTEPELTKLKEVELNYEEIGDVLPRNLMLSSIVDKITGYSIHYTMNNTGIVSNVDVKNKQNETSYKVNYSSNSYCTTITSFDGKKHFYYFDNYGRCKLEMDDKGRSVTYNYDEYENGESKHLTSVSSVQTNSRNLLENHSFEDSDNLFQSESLGWKKTGDTNSVIKTKVGGVYGDKYLFIDKVANETITISQTVLTNDNKQFSLKGFIKQQAKNSNESIASGSIKVRICGTYTRVEEVVTKIDSTSSKTETKPVSHYHHKEVTFSGNSNWKPFIINSTLPSDAYDITIRVEIVASGIASEVGIDDLQLCSGKQKTRYNLIENGYMEFSENNLPKGWNFENKETEDQIIEVDNTDAHSSILGNKVMCFKQGDILQHSTNVNFKIKKMYKEIQCLGLSGEQLVFSVFGKAFTSSGNIFRSYIKIYHTNGQYRIHRFDFDKNFKNWQMLTRAVTAEYDYDKVEVGVEYSGGSNAYFDCFQLYKDSYGKYYNYDERGNIIEIVSDDANSMRIDYDENNQIKEIVTQDGSSFKYDYDAKGRLEKVTDLSGNVVEITYDTNDYVIQTTITTPNGETIINSQERDQWGEITKATDEHGNQTLIGVNYLNQITQIEQANGLLESFNYNQDLSLNHIGAVVENKAHQNSFTYDDTKQVKYVESANGTKYNFIYDSFGRLTKISVNGEIINQFSYNETINTINKGLVSRKQYGSNGDYFDFIYNEEDQIEEVKLNGIAIVEYEYNEEGLLSQVKDVRNNTIKYFTYDLKGKLIKVVDDENRSIAYTYDNLDHLQKTSYKIDDIEKSFDYEYDYETNEYTKEGYFNRLEKEFGDEIVKGGMNAKGTYGAKPTLKTINQVYDDSINMKVYQFEDNYDFIWYKLDTFNANKPTGYSNGKYFDLDIWKRRFFYNKTFYIWIKPSGTFKEENLFKFQKEDANENRSNLALLNITSSGKIGYKEEAKGYYSKTSNSVLKLNEWNLVGIKIFKNESEDSCKCILFINDEIASEFKTTIDVTKISNLVIASQTPTTTSATTSKKNTITTSLSLPFKVCMMSFGSYNYTKEDMKAIYNEGLKYLVNSTPVQKATGVSYYNGSVYQDFDVITLNGSLESSRGNKPVALMKTDSSFKVEKARIFKYDSTIQRHVYGAFDDVSNFTHGNHSLLAYNLNLKEKGAISFRFMIDEEQTTKRTILTSYHHETQKLGVFIEYIDNKECICFEVNGQRLVCNSRIIYHHWYSIALFIKDNNFKIFVDGNLLYEENITCDLTNTITYLGSLKDETNSLNGYIEMFAYSDKEFSTPNSIVQSICENGNTISIRKHLDSLGRVNQKVIKTNKGEYKTTYAYDKLRITKEVEEDTHNIKYEYDSMGNITKKQFLINDIVESASSYQYDKLGRLIEEVKPNGDIETFTYDENGNILTHKIKNKEGTLITNEKYNYSITIKDQLISIQNATTGNIIKEFKYENSYKGNPTTIVKDGVSQNLVWEGRKLKQIGNTSFVYNEEGIRIKKAGSNFVENYTLEGNRIIKLHRDSEGGSYDMYFNYDEQGELVGLSCEGKEYFYIRDITGNITKIVDEDGRCVVKYDYDAWGNFKKTIYIDNYVSHSNPFVYKGYFFDSETGWYYLKSRYYDPSIRRFINADNYNYLDSESLNGINLYSYCGNNPILGYDPEGTWSWGKFWGVVAVVAIAAVAIAVTVASCGAAAAGAGFLASCAVSSIGAYTLAATATTVATIATYVVATTTVIGITAFAIADIQSIVTDGQNNYLSFLGDAYEPIKNSLYSIAFILPYLAQFAPMPSSTSTSTNSKKTIGSYKIYRDGKVVYCGKGTEARMLQSMKEHCGTSCVYYPASSSEIALANEAYFIGEYGGAKSMGGTLDNKINSPGLRYLNEWF